MSQRFENLKVGLDEDLEEKLQWLVPNFSQYHIHKKSIDARRRHAPHFVYSVEVFEPNESPPQRIFQFPRVEWKGPAPLIVGAGPAGLFTALRLAERGIKCHLFEQGSLAEKRIRSIARFWRTGEMDPYNNVGFGEGGAGLYSDGKLITRIRSPHIPYVLNRLVQFGAPKEIEFLSNPHVGSDRIRRLLPHLRSRLIQLGVQIHFDTPVSEILLGPNEVQGLRTQQGQTFPSPVVILACGHSATPLFEHLRQKQVDLEGKSFAVGLRVEHPQGLIDQIQYREAAGHPQLGPATYRLTSQDKKQKKGIYSFCMCPGGYVLSAGTEPERTVCNGMSNYHRNSGYANSAIVVTVDYRKSFGDDPFQGLAFRQTLEERAQALVLQQGGHHQLPAQKLLDFMESTFDPRPLLKTSCPSGAIASPLHELLPQELQSSLKLGIESFERQMPGFLSPQSILFAVESRTSCPLRITRHSDTLQSTSHEGLYPTGEGAGYAGGITSAACDGVRVAEALVAQMCSQLQELS